MRKAYFGLFLTAVFLVTTALGPQHHKSLQVNVTEYAAKMEGFWLGQSIANWTGLITEMDRNKAPFYTDEDWGKQDTPSKWGHFVRHSSVIDFYTVPKGKVWGSDDDTDIEYMYHHLLNGHSTGMLTGKEIQTGWLKHIYSNEDAPIDANSFERENFLWVSNERARELMATKGVVPPATSDPKYNQHYNMIDAQLTTEIFGLLAPGRPDTARRIAALPIQTTARGNAEAIAHFYVNMHSNAVFLDKKKSLGPQLMQLANQARKGMDDQSLPAKIYDFVKADYVNNSDKENWERTRNKLYELYQIQGKDGYQYKAPFDSEINFGASLVSLFYGQGDFKRTLQIGSLAGWDSDNPTATWGGLLGFIYGADKVRSFFPNKEISNLYWIHRTRRNFPDHTPNKIGEDTFALMGKRSIEVIKTIIKKQMGGRLSEDADMLVIPIKSH